MFIITSNIKKIYCIILGFMLAMLSWNLAQAARFPNSVYKTFNIIGPEATQIAKFLGMEISENNHLILQLQNLPPSAENPIVLKNGSQPFMNKIEYFATEPPKIVLSGVWLDHKTGSGYPIPTYSFSSPLFKKENHDFLQWSKLANRLWKYGKNTPLPTKPLKAWQTPDSSKPWFIVQLHQLKDWENGGYSYVVNIGVDDLSLAERKNKIKKYEEWRKKNWELD